MNEVKSNNKGFEQIESSVLRLRKVASHKDSEILI